MRQIPLEEIWTPEELEKNASVIEIEIDSEKLDTIFATFVDKTKSWPVERIVELGCDLNSIIYKYRPILKRAELLVEFEEVLSRL